MRILVHWKRRCYEELVMEVTDNLLENAVRYAQKSIALQIKKKDGFENLFRIRSWCG